MTQRQTLVKPHALSGLELHFNLVLIEALPALVELFGARSLKQFRRDGEVVL